MKPVLIRAFGRTGTTLLMQLMKTSRDVCVPNGYPFESRMLTYFGRIAKLISNGEVTDYTDGDVTSSANAHVGKPPYSLAGLVNEKRMQKRMIRSMWNQFSTEVELETGNDYEYYAEKVALDLAPFLNENLPVVKNIFVARDPRGELSSIISFNKKRGFDGFGWQKGDDVESFSKRMAVSRKKYFQQLAKFKNNGNILILRFEDLVSDLHVVSKELEEFLGVQLDPSVVEGEQEQYKFHMTSNSISLSKEKWKDELPQNVIDYFEKEMKEELEYFGYSQTA